MSGNDHGGTLAAEDLNELDLHLDPESLESFLPGPIESEGLEAARPHRVAESLKALLAQVNEAFPGRNKASDGTLGDTSHQARPSDHNPRIIDGAFGVVTALDITHDPAHGCDAGRIAQSIWESRDARVKYIIWNRKIANSSPIGSAPAWTWRAYTGANPHNKHCHISVKAAKERYDDSREWTLPTADGTEASALPEPAEDPEALITAALQAICGSTEKPLLRALVDAQDAIAVLLARHAEAERVPALDDTPLEAPAPSLEQLRPGYLELWESCRINPQRAGEVAWHLDRLRRGRLRYQEVSERTRAPWWFIGIVHALEASFSFAGHLHNGDPLTRRTVQVPRGRPLQWNPPSDWVSSAVDAITFDGHAGLSDWGIAETLFRLEGYNGFGYRPRGINSPYLWSFANHYTAGKFVADGRFSATAVSKQCGAAVMLKALVNAGEVRL
jgi:lysozyme family protein